jgi:hypothetical protein
MDSSLKYAGLIRGLIYPVQFENDPRNGIDRVLDLVVNEGAMDATPMEYLAAIREALASNEALGELIPQDHSEDVIRRYLVDVGDAIAKRWGAASA